MKVIDLLNKIANGEEVPKAIRFGKIIYEYEEGIDYVNGKGLDKEFLIDKICISKEDLNDEVEIIEDKKIEKIDIGKMLQTKKWKRDKKTYQTINELIDEVKKIKGDKSEK